MLSPYRVIDLTNENGLLCGQILADLGADVVQVEPPEGSSARRVGPWYKGEPGAERSLFWWSYTRNKRSIALDLKTQADRAELLRLVAGADFLIESEPPGRLDAMGLGYSDLSRLNPGLVYVSISPFGSDGPKAQWQATDLTIMAAAGPFYLSGEAAGIPTRVSVPQAHAHAGADAAVGALIAHAARKRSGRGQHVDISAQQSATLSTMFRCLDVLVDEVPAARVAGGYQVGGAFIVSRYPLRDGWVVLGPAILPSTGHFMTRLLTWAKERGFADEGLLEEDWGSFALRLITKELPPEAYAPAHRVLGEFFATLSKAELMQAAVERKLLLAPVLRIDEIADSPQLAQRDYPSSVEISGVGSVRYPGAFAKFGAAPLEYRHPPPRLDEHGVELRAEPARSPAPTAEGASPERCLEGVKILDLFWILAGPGATRMLADYGATVVKVESSKSLDTMRLIPPYQFHNPHPEGACAYQCANVNKLGISLDVASEAGRELIYELVRWADVVTESFAPGVMDGLGFGWERLREIKPDLIMISSCLMGQTGPWRDLTGFGNLAASVAGFQPLASWSGRPPCGPYGAYTDFLAVRYNALSILAALEFRERTGKGQYIDQAQAEAALHFLTPAYLDYTVNGCVAEPKGNDDDDLFPHAAFPAAGNDRWVALAVRGDEEWRALCELIDQPALVSRRGERELVLEAIATWTAARDPEDIEAALQSRGIPAHRVSDTPSVASDPQLNHRGHFIEIDHHIFPSTTVESSRLKLSTHPARTPESAVSVGRDNRHVLEALLGYSPEQIARLAEQGVLI